MNILFDRKELLGALQYSKKALPARPSHPVLGFFLVTGSEGKVSVSAFDLAIALTSTFEISCHDTFKFLLPKLALEVLAACEGEEITLEVESDRLKLVTETGEFELATIAAEEYPEIPSPTVPFVTVDSPTEFVAAIKQVASVVSTDATKQILTGVHLSSKDGKLELAATDGHRLLVKQLDIDFPFDNITIPSDIVTKLKPSETLEIAIEGNLIWFHSGDSVACGRVLEGGYPHYRSLLSETFAHTVELSASELAKAVSLASLVLGSNKRYLICNLSDKGSHISGKTDHNSDVTFDILGELSGDIRFGFNPDYLKPIKDFFSVPRLQINDPIRPLVFEEGLTKYLVMPIQIRE